jgi:hypothetical protein
MLAVGFIPRCRSRTTRRVATIQPEQAACISAAGCYFSRMRTLVAILIGLSLTGLVCSCVSAPEKKPVGPQSSDANYMPWNTPQPGEGTGGMGGAFERR